MTCERCDDKAGIYKIRLLLVSNGREELKDVKMVCADCARQMEFDNVVEPGFCDTCGCDGPSGETRCPGCARDLAGL